MTAEAFAQEIASMVGVFVPKATRDRIAARIRERDEALRAYRQELPTLTEELNPWIAGGHEAHIIRGED